MEEITARKNRKYAGGLILDPKRGDLILLNAVNKTTNIWKQGD